MRLRSLVTLIACAAVFGVLSGAHGEPTPESPEERLAALEAERDRVEIERGARVFARSCAACHGREGKGDGPGAADLDPPPRDLSARQFRFRTTPSGAAPLREDLERTIRRGLPGTAMPAFGRLFSQGEISDLTEFILALGGPDGREPAPIDVPAIPEVGPRSVSEGRSLYLLLGCWRCHGVNGAGNGPSAKFLQDENERPIHSTDFRYEPLKGGREPEAIVRTLLTGLNGSPMPAYGEALLIAREDAGDLTAIEEQLSADDRSGLTDFLASSPLRAALEALNDEERLALRDDRLTSLAHYVRSIRPRRGFGFRLLQERPELEPRRP